MNNWAIIMHINTDNRRIRITICICNLNFELQPDHIIMISRIRMINCIKLRIRIFTRLTINS